MVRSMYCAPQVVGRYAMSTSEQVDLHADGEELLVESPSERQKPLEQPDDTVKGAVDDQVRITSRWKKVSITVLTLLGYTSMYAALSTVTAFYAIVAQNHNVPTYVSGIVLGVTNLCLAVLAPIIGFFLPHLGLKFTQVAGLFLGGGSQVLFGFVSKMPTPTLFIAFSFLLKLVEGIGLAMFTTASLTVLTQLYLERKGTLASLVELSVSIGFVIGVPVGGGLQEVGGFVLPLLVFGGISLFMTLLLLINVHPTECNSATLPWRIVLKMLKNVSFVLLAVLCPIVASGALYSLTSYLGQFLSIQFGLSVGVIGAIYLSGLATNTLASLSVGPLSDKLKIPRYLLIVGLVVGAVGCVLIGPASFIATPKLWLSILGWAISQAGIAFAMVTVYPAMFEAIKMLHVEEAVLASTLAGILVTTYAVGGFLGPVFSGVLVYWIDFQWMAAICGLILLICALVLVIATVIEKIWNRKRNAKNDVVSIQLVKT